MTQEAAVDLNKIVRVFIKIRDHKAARTKEFDAEMAKLDEQMDTLKAVLLQHMQANNQTQVGTESGTAYVHENISCSAADWAVFYDFIKQHDAFDLLEQRIARARVKKYMDDHEGSLPPGVNVFKELEVKIRRK